MWLDYYPEDERKLREMLDNLEEKQQSPGQLDKYDKI